MVTKINKKSKSMNLNVTDSRLDSSLMTIQ
jgi:hypothetical protein